MIMDTLTMGLDLDHSKRTIFIYGLNNDEVYKVMDRI